MESIEQNQIHNMETVVNDELDPWLRVLELFGDFFWVNNQDKLT